MWARLLWRRRPSCARGTTLILTQLAWPSSPPQEGCAFYSPTGYKPGLANQEKSLRRSRPVPLEFLGLVWPFTLVFSSNTGWVLLPGEQRHCRRAGMGALQGWGGGDIIQSKCSSSSVQP